MSRLDVSFCAETLEENWALWITLVTFPVKHFPEKIFESQIKNMQYIKKHGWVYCWVRSCVFFLNFKQKSYLNSQAQCPALLFIQALCRLFILTVKISLHNSLNTFHDTLAVSVLARVICLQLDLLKRESKRGALCVAASRGTWQMFFIAHALKLKTFQHDITHYKQSCVGSRASEHLESSGPQLCYLGFTLLLINSRLRQS